MMVKQGEKQRFQSKRRKEIMFPIWIRMRGREGGGGGGITMEANYFTSQQSANQKYFRPHTHLLFHFCHGQGRRQKVDFELKTQSGQEVINESQTKFIFSGAMEI